MDTPPRPQLILAPTLSDFREQRPETIAQALVDLYEAAFATGDRTHRMEVAGPAPAVLADACQELFFLRREIDAVADPIEAVEDPPPSGAGPHDPADREGLRAELDTCREFVGDDRRRFVAIERLINGLGGLGPGDPIPALARQVLEAIRRVIHAPYPFRSDPSGYPAAPTGGRPESA